MAGGVAALIALVSGGPGDALLVVAATIAVQQLEGNVIQPLVLGRAVDLHPLVTTCSVVGGLVLGGLLGGFLALPVVATVARAAHHYRLRSSNWAKMDKEAGISPAPSGSTPS